jgi:ribosomal protein S18 acetylase RimI-like enzyme
MPATLLSSHHPGAVSDGWATPPGVLLRLFCADRDTLGIVLLADAVARSAADRPGPRPAGPRPRGSGLVAELTSRTGRQVEAWLATIPASDVATERVVGLISLVRSQSATGIRQSIGWLLVHPDARRQGIARALVAHACRSAMPQIGAAVWVECRSDWNEAIAFWHALGFEDRRIQATAWPDAPRPRH